MRDDPSLRSGQALERPTASVEGATAVSSAPDGSVDLEALKARHTAGHGPCGCLQPDRCPSARYLAVIERQAGELAEQRAWIERLETARGKLYAACKRLAEGDHLMVHHQHHGDLFAECAFTSCRSYQATLRMGNPRRKAARQ